MHREQEMKNLGLFGVYQESYRIIFSWRKIFSQITLTLIFPLSLNFFIETEVSNVLFGMNSHNTKEMNETQLGIPRYEKLSDILSSEWITFLLFKLLYFGLHLTFTLLSTSAVVYTVASFYSVREVTFNKVMIFIPKVWKRLMLTFLCTFVAFLSFNFMVALVTIIWVLTIGVQNIVVASSVFIILYAAGYLYLSSVWQLANVVSVLEESYGFKAMSKSKELIKGKMGLAILIFLKLNVTFFLIKYLFSKLVLQGSRLGSLDITAYGILCFLLQSTLLLFQLVTQTVLYFVCKSYHHENIDKSALSDHLEVYLGESEPLKSKNLT